jgi:predicted dehydrogenase
MNKLRWGILATGHITHKLAEGIRHSETGELYAVGSRTQASADEWAETYGVQHSHGSYEALLDDGEVDAVYIASPNSQHAGHVIQSAHAKKHILCEKPLASNAEEAEKAIEACRNHGVFMLEAFAWRAHPSTLRLVELIKQGVIGEVRVIEASFGFNLHGQPGNIRMVNALSGGSIMDVGCYPISFAQLVAGTVLGQAFTEPTEVHAAGHVGRSGVDEWAAATLRFDSDIVASLKSAVQCVLERSAVIYGENGKLLIENPWLADGRFRLEVESKDPELILCESDKPLYSHEVDMLGECVAKGLLEAPPPSMGWMDSLAQQRTVDRWRKAVGVRFACDDHNPS